MKWKLKNPANVLIPIFLFVILENFYGVDIAGSISVFIGFLLFSCYFIFKGKGMLNKRMVPILFMVIIATFILKFIDFGDLQPVMGELVMLFFSIILLLFRKPITKRILSGSGKNAVGVQENLTLFFITLKLTIIIFMIYIVGFFIAYRFHKDVISDFLFKEEELLLFFCMWIYITIRIYLLRGYIDKEDYWPILNEKGGVIGYEPRGEVYSSKKVKNPLKKNCHPVVRVLLISDNKLLLRRNDFIDFTNSGKWDVSVSGHLLYGETYEECIDRLLKRNYNVEKGNAQYLLKYTFENRYERQWVFLHYMLANNLVLQNTDSLDVKLWTTTQILSDLDSDTFTDKLKKEVILLKNLSFPYLFN